MDGVEGHEKVTPIRGGGEVDSGAEQTHAAGTRVECGDVVPAVLRGGIAGTPFKEVHATADVDQVRTGAARDGGNKAISTLARISQVESPRGDPYEFGCAWRGRTRRLDGGPCGARARRGDRGAAVTAHGGYNADDHPTENDHHGNGDEPAASLASPGLFNEDLHVTLIHVAWSSRDECHVGTMSFDDSINVS